MIREKLKLKAEINVTHFQSVKNASSDLMTHSIAERTGDLFLDRRLAIAQCLIRAFFLSSCAMKNGEEEEGGWPQPTFL